MRQHAGVFAANFSSNLLWQNCFAPKKSASCAEPRRVAAGILDVCQGGATMGLRQTRLLRRMFSYARWPKRPAFVCGEGCRSREGQKPLPHGKKRIPAPVTRGGQGRPPLQSKTGTAQNGTSRTPSPTKSQGVCAKGRAEASAPTRQNRSRAKRDVGDAVPYEITRGVCNGRAEASAPARQNRNRAKRDVEDAVPYTLCHCEERSDAAIRSPQPKETDSRASDAVTGAE